MYRYFFLLFLTILCLNGDIYAQKGKEKELSHRQLTKFRDAYFEGVKSYQINNYDKALEFFEKCYDIQPGPGVCMELAKTLSALENDKEALKYAEEAYNFSPADEYMFNFYFELLLSLEKQDEAASLMADYIENFLDDDLRIDYMKRLSVLYLKNNRFDDALDLFDQLEEERGFSLEDADVRKRIYLMRKDYDKALDVLNKMIALDSAYSYQLEKAELLGSQGETEKARKEFERILLERPDLKRASFDYASLLLKMDEIDQALNYLKEGLKARAVRPSEKVRLLNYLKNKRVDKGVLLDLAEELVKIHPINPEVLRFAAGEAESNGREAEAVNFLGRALSYNQDNFDLRLEYSRKLFRYSYYEKLDSLSEDNLSRYPNQPAFYLLSGLALQELGNHEEALMQYTTGKNFVLDTRDLETQFDLNIADAHYESGNLSSADRIYDNLYSRFPEDPSILNNYSYFLANTNQKLKQARDMIEKALSFSSGDPNLLDTYAWVLFKLKEYKLAETQLNKALIAAPEEGVILEHMGDVQYHLGNTERAIDYWNRALKNGAANPEIVERKIKTKEYVSP